MSIYVASSWRNVYQPDVVGALREAGHDVYDFKDPSTTFHWSELDPDWQSWTTAEFVRCLALQKAERAFRSDMDALRDAEVIVLVLPCGRSAHLEAGFAAGAGKPVFIFSPPTVRCEPELSYKMAAGITDDIDQLIVWLASWKTRVPPPLTLELTDYCPHKCSFCSSGAGPDGKTYLDVMEASRQIRDTDAHVIHLSGGEPLAHPSFWTILGLAQAKVGARNVRVMSNSIRWLAYNVNAISGIRVDANMTPEAGLDHVNILKRIEQGRERDVPVVHFSRNHGDGCPGDCGHRVVRPDGTVAATPCRKDVPA